MASEKRLIDADACGRYIVSRMGFDNAYLEVVLYYMEEYTEQNEVDAVEVVHGRWIETEEGTVCSECHKHPFEDGEFAVANYHGNYCPLRCKDGRRKERR